MESPTPFATIVWSLEDIKSIRPHWSDEKVQTVAAVISRTLEERSVEEGWTILSDLLDMVG